ncbi:MAG: metal ABC transporter substrate-binding protein [Thermoleophilaceae bacterium]
MRPLASPRALCLLAAALVVFAAGCGGDSSSSGDRDAAVNAVATTTQVADIVRNVGGARIEVRQLLQPNSDPHGYEPRPSDAAALAEADVVIRSGGEVDEWLDGLIANAGGDAPVVDLIETAVDVEGDPHPGDDAHEDEAHEDEGIEGHADGEDGVDDGDHAHGDGEDPHWWQDPRHAVRAVAAIEAALTEADPGGRAVYRRNADAYAERLRRLDRNVAACIERIPPAKRRLVTTHDALGHYADRYGLTVVGALIPSRSTAAQPSAGDTQDLVEQIREQDVEAIFPESSLAPRLEQAVARETGATVGRPLWVDALGPAGSGGATYVESIQSNTAAIVDGLSGGAERCRPDA